MNTLLLAYAGASMPLLLLFAASDQSLDKVANSELISVEIVRTLCGSIGLVAAVPITTVLAALVTERASGGDETASAEEAAPLTRTMPTSPPLAAPVGDDDADDAEDDTEEPAPAPSWDDFAPEDNERW